MPFFPPPPSFYQTILGVFGAEGAAWLAALPALVAECEARFDIQVGEPFQLSYNYVAPAQRSDGAPLVLKLGVPNQELTSEMEALRLYDGDGCARLLHAEPERGIALIERLLPGTPLVTLQDDEQATRIAAGVLRRLWRPLPAGLDPAQPWPFKTLADLMQGLDALRLEFNGGSGPFPEALVSRAQALSGELLASAPPPILLHGDFHHYNILLCAQDTPGRRCDPSGSWLAIDAKGVLGEPAWDLGAFLYNPLDLYHRPDLPRLLRRRVDMLCEQLELDRQRLIGWGIAQAVLSAWWSYESHEEPDWTLRVGQVLADW